MRWSGREMNSRVPGYAVEAGGRLGCRLTMLSLCCVLSHRYSLYEVNWEFFLHPAGSARFNVFGLHEPVTALSLG